MVKKYLQGSDHDHLEKFKSSNLTPKCASINLADALLGKSQLEQLRVSTHDAHRWLVKSLHVS